MVSGPPDTVPTPQKTQRLVLAILDFLYISIEDGTVKADDREGLEVASLSTSLT
jgi:hypothetical protein